MNLASQFAIVVDGSNLAMSSHYANDTLSTSTGRKTGAVFGMLRSLSVILERFVPAQGQPVTAIVAWDCRRHESWRRRIFPDYKANRDGPQSPEEQQRLEEYVEQLPILKRVLSALGLQQITAPEMEADDLAGFICRLQTEGRSTMLVSGDKDWLQLIGPRTTVWQNTKGRLVHLENFEEVTGAVDPDQYLKMLGIIGDKGDNVPGCAGIGEKYALDFLRGVLKRDGKRFEKIATWVADPDGLRRSLVLVDLVHPVVKPVSVKIEPGLLDRHELREICQELGFNSITADFESFVSKFERIAS